MATTATITSPLSLSNSSADGLVVSGERNPEVVGFEAEVVAFFVDAAELLGVPKSVAAIYGIVFASPEPLSFSDITSRLGLSKGSVSQGLRLLREVGALKESNDSESGGRPVQRYEPDMELRKLVKHFLETRLQTQLDSGSGRLQRIEEAFPGFDSEQEKVIQGRINYLLSWHKKARALLPLIRTALMLVPKK